MGQRETVVVSQLQQAGGRRGESFPQLLSQAAECQGAQSRIMTQRSDLAAQLHMVLFTEAQRHPPGQCRGGGVQFLRNRLLPQRVPTTKPPKPRKPHMKYMSIEQTSKLRPKGITYILNPIRVLRPIFMAKGSHPRYLMQRSTHIPTHNVPSTRLLWLCSTSKGGLTPQPSSDANQPALVFHFVRST